MSAGQPMSFAEDRRTADVVSGRRQAVDVLDFITLAGPNTYADFTLP
jgi:hypothetical protein